MKGGKVIATLLRLHATLDLGVIVNLAKKGALHCLEFSDDDRQQTFDTFWGELDWEQRKVFVA